MDLESICHAIFKTAFLSSIGPFYGVTPNFWQRGILAVIYRSRVDTMYTTSDKYRSVIVKVVHPSLERVGWAGSVSKETVNTFHTLVPRQTSLCRWRSIKLGPF